MKFTSAWSRGLWYASICGGVLTVIPFVATIVAIFIGADWQQGLFACAITLAIWGGFGFLVGFVSHRDPTADVVTGSIASTHTSVMKQWVYRLLAGLLLAHIAAAAVQLIFIGFVAVIFGGLDGYLERKPNRDEMQFHFLGVSLMAGASIGSGLAAFFGVMLAPMRYESRAIMRSSLFAAVAGALAGAWFAGPVGMLHPRFVTLEWIAILVMVTGGLTGIATAIMLRLLVNR